MAVPPKKKKGTNPLSVKKKMLFVPNTKDKSTIKTDLKRKQEETDVEAAKKKKRKQKHTKPSTASETSFIQPT